MTEPQEHTIPAKCFKCGGSRIVPRHGEGSEVFECDDCRARVAHGEQMPHIIVQPHQFEHGGIDWRFIVITFQHPDGSDHQVVIDRRLAAMTASALQSIA